MPREVNLIEQILDQGQRLRNSVVQSILKNDPFYSVNTKEKNWLNDESEQKELTTAEKHKFVAYLKGDAMSRDDEKQVLETFRAMSNADICEVTERSYSSLQNDCDCGTCKAYYQLNSCANNSNIVPPLNLRCKAQSCSILESDRVLDRNHPFTYLKYVDTLKIAVHSLKLNHEGKMKVSSSFNSNQTIQDLNTTYFIEYDIPICLVKNIHKKSKVNTGLDSRNIVKLCSKKFYKEGVYFKQISIHDVFKLHMQNLDAIDLKFLVSCRNPKQKSVNVIGYAKFNMGSFRDTKYLICNQELVLFLKDGTPISVGSIKISLQLGCGRLYFGKEFLDSLSNNKENNVLPEIVSYEKIDDLMSISESISFDDFTVRDQFCDKKVDKKVASNDKQLIVKKVEPSKRPKFVKSVKEHVDSAESKHIELRPKVVKSVTEHKNSTELKNKELIEKPILFGFIYIAEVEYLEVKQQTFLTCQPFCQEDVIYSNLVSGGSNPTFNFQQTIPLVYEEDFVCKLRDNFTIFEFWEKSTTCNNNLIGICKIPLHQYYLAFRNPVIVKYLDRNKHPVIGTDWYEPISDPSTGVITGQVQILVALGSETQIHNLERERGFKDDIVTKAKRIAICTENRQINTTRKTVDKTIKNKLPHANPISLNKQLQPTPLRSNTKSEDLMIENHVPIVSESEKVDKASQSDAMMEQTGTNTLGNFLQQVIAQQPTATTLVEKGTNTDFQKIESVDVKKTSDLLDSLQHVLNVDGNNKPTPKGMFKAHIVIDSALHLPSRKKCKAKKIKGKVVREEILPSTYVTFEVNNVVKITRVIQKNTKPKWDFNCDIALPTDLLTNNQSRLIFKVWRTSNHAFTPNPQTDTVIGFTALDLTVLLAGLPNIQGWFNIVDFISKCNGQIKISITPLENLSEVSSSHNRTAYTPPSVVPTQEEPGEMLSNTLKRKFIELDEITQRLRSRLNYVTNDESDTSNDDVADEFEKDINTLCVEDDYEMIDFVREAQDLNLHRVSTSLMKLQGTTLPDNQTLVLFDDDEDKKNSVSQNLSLEQFALDTSEEHSVSSLDAQLTEGKQRIDTLLQKLSLISKEPFSNRYVSGCSVSRDVESNSSTQEDILSELGIEKQFDANSYFGNKFLEELNDIQSTSSSSIQSERDAPDGEGTSSDTKRV